MPQATDEDRERYKRAFPDIGCEHAVAELRKRGFELTEDYDWIAPRRPSEEETFWIGFLMDEWDFGGWEMAGSYRVKRG